MANRVEPTCEEEGSYGEVVYCTVCKKKLSRETKTINALGHDYDSTTHLCTRCGTPDPDFSYTVKFDSNGSVTVDDQRILVGKTATMPTAPEREEYTFLGWQLGGKDYDFATPVTADITFVANWDVEKFTVRLIPTAVRQLRNRKSRRTQSLSSQIHLHVKVTLLRLVQRREKVQLFRNDSCQSIIGQAVVWVGLCLWKVAAYAISFCPIPRKRYVIMSLAPSLLGIIPLIAFILIPVSFKPLLTFCTVSAFTGLISPCPDYMDIIAVMRQTNIDDMIQAANDGLYKFSSVS